MHKMLLTDIKDGDTCEIICINKDFPLRRRLQDLGFTSGTIVECLFKSPLGDPVAYRIKDTTIALRCEDSSEIKVKPLTSASGA